MTPRGEAELGRGEGKPLCAECWLPGHRPGTAGMWAEWATPGTRAREKGLHELPGGALTVTWGWRSSRGGDRTVTDATSPSSRLNPKNVHQRPTVALLCGPHVKGAQGISCGRHLANHDVQVILFLPNFVKMLESITNELSLFSKTQGQQVSSLKGGCVHRRLPWSLGGLLAPPSGNWRKPVVWEPGCPGLLHPLSSWAQLGTR